MSDRLLTIQETAEMLGVPIGTIYAWRKRKRHLTGDAPKGLKVGRAVKYRESTVEAWLRERELKG